MVFGADERPLYDIKANLFKGLAHPYRIRILEILAGAHEVPVSGMLADTGLEASHLSAHLAVLRRYGLVVSERRASVVYYHLAFPQVAELLQVARTLLGELLRDTQRHQPSAISPRVPARQSPGPVSISANIARSPSSRTTKARA